MANYKKAIINSRAYKTILKDKETGRLSHTYLLISEDMDYVKEFAKLQAQILLDIENDNVAKNKAEKGIHPDILIYGEEEKINTAKVTEIASEVFVRPYELDKKVYILINMNEANDEAQNKLLKTIEEPPANVFFILGSTGERSLLKTVLSRAKKIELDLISDTMICEMLENENVNSQDSKIFASCSNGIFSRAYKMATNKDFIYLYDNIFKCLNKMNSSRDVLEYSNIFSNKNINKEELANVFMLITRDVCMAKIGKEELISNKHKINDLISIGEQFSLEALYKIIEYCLMFKEDLVFNTNVNAVVDEFLLKVVEVKVKCKR